MILFVFEGGKAEPTVFDSIGKLFLPNEELCVVKCRHDLPTLYSNLRANGYDLFRSLPFEDNGIIKVNNILDEMLDFFDDETENGKLYINYPMIESLKYTKEMPDADYWKYVATRDECAKHLFKGKAERFAYAQAKAFRFIDLDKTDKETVKNNWESLKIQNVCKAHYLVSGCNTIPSEKSTINQKSIFEAQKDKYVNTDEMVSILNSFPIFLYDYLK